MRAKEKISEEKIKLKNKSKRESTFRIDVDIEIKKRLKKGYKAMRVLKNMVKWIYHFYSSSFL